jgi:L-rhamnose mutarotase
MKPANTTLRTLALVVTAALGLLLAGFNGARPAPQRHAWITGLKPEMAARYRQLHAKPWPSVNRMLKECQIQNFSIWQREIEGKLYLFAYLEYTGRDFDADMKKMAADPEAQRWWKETDPCQIPLPDAAANGKIWSDLTEVYYLP